ncbi:MAG: hypothetical protein IJK64_04955 [Clostridia bacterium]|nr:hypothetical protein [Clostridia bacterium]
MSELLEYKCPACGGALVFDAETQALKCPYCESVFSIEDFAGMQGDLSQPAEPQPGEWESENAAWSEEETSGLLVYSCQSCGGEVVGDETTGASSCPYCGNPVVMKGQFSGMLRPDLILPFKLDKAAAKAALNKHLEGKKLLPKIFKDQNHIDEIKGLYVPYWLFSCDANANILYKAETRKNWSDSNYRYTETSYYNVLRTGSLHFDALPVDGSEKMDDTLMESIEPFDASEAVPFNAAYLSGYLADKYDVSAEQSAARADERIRKSTVDAFRDTVSGYDSVETDSAEIDTTNGKARYALYPVWLLNTTWNGQKYTFAMNGQTGKFVGDLPLDKNAFWKWVGILTAALGGAAYAVMWLIALL